MQIFFSRLFFELPASCVHRYRLLCAKIARSLPMLSGELKSCTFCACVSTSGRSVKNKHEILLFLLTVSIANLGHWPFWWTNYYIQLTLECVLTVNAQNEPYVQATMTNSHWNGPNVCDRISKVIKQKLPTNRFKQSVRQRYVSQSIHAYNFLHFNHNGLSLLYRYKRARTILMDTTVCLFITYW